MAFQRYQSQQSASRETSDIGWTEGDPLRIFPVEVLLHYVPPRQIVNVYRLVCKGWKGFFDDPSVWQQRMKRRGNYDSRFEGISGINWAKLYLHTVPDREPNFIRSFDSEGNLSPRPWTLAHTDWFALNDDGQFMEELHQVSRGGVFTCQQQ